MLADQVILQDFNPYPQFYLPPNYVVIDSEGLGSEVANPFDPNDEVTSGLSQVLFINTGSLRKADDARLKVESLVVTGKMTATIPAAMAARMSDNLERFRESVNSKESYILAMRVQGEIDAEEDELKQLDLAEAGSGDDEPEQGGEPKPAKKTPINAIVVADIDWLSDIFFQVREEGNRNLADAPELRFQNVTLVLNVLDSLAGDDRFIDIRKRAPHRPTLTKIEEATKGARMDTRNQLEKFAQDLKAQQQQAQEEFDKKLAEIEARTDLPEMERRVLMARTMVRAQQKLDREREAAERDNRRQVVATERKLEQEIRGIQNRYKAFAVLLPPLPPILLGIFMYIHRRLGEREGVSKDRLRYGADEKATT